MLARWQLMTDAERPSITPIDRAFLTHQENRTELILVRHGQQQFPDPAVSKLGDWVDPPLSEIGKRQALVVGQQLADTKIDVVYASHLARARDTGAAIAAHHGLEPLIEEDLREIEPFRDLPRDSSPQDLLGNLRLLGARERFVRHRTWDVYPHSEPQHEFRNRCVNMIEGILAHHPGQTIVVACHGGVINAFVGEVLGLSTAMFFRPAHASIHRVRSYEHLRVIESLNETHYLVGSDPALVTY